MNTDDFHTNYAEEFGGIQPSPATPSADEKIGAAMFRKWCGNSYEWDALTDIERQRWNRLAASHANEREESRKRDAESDSIVASCNCLTKTNEVLHHAPGCKYRLIVERDVARSEIQQLSASLAEKERELEQRTREVIGDEFIAQDEALQSAYKDLQAELATAQKELKELQEYHEREKAGWVNAANEQANAARASALKLLELQNLRSQLSEAQEEIQRLTNLLK